jgi:iron(III) transport system ATP-binding protein
MAPSDARVVIREVSKQFVRQGGARVNAVDNVSLDVKAGEFVVLLGPSGCGKSTLLRCVAGLERPDQGEIRIHGRQMFSAKDGLMLPPEERDISMMFQSYALWPHMSVRKNIAYPLETRRVAKDDVRTRVDAIMAKMAIPELADEYPGHLSGGQQQRVALARSLVTDPEVILFDEPLSNLDAKIRKHLRVEISRMQREFGFSAIYVTHDQEEAMHIADRVVIMRQGRLVRVGESRNIYEKPESRYVAGMLGWVNEFKGNIAALNSGTSGPTALVDSGIGRVIADARGQSDLAPGNPVWVGMRPQAIAISRSKPQDGEGRNQWKGTVVRSTFLGAHMDHLVRVADAIVEVWSTGSEAYPEGEDVWLSAAPALLFAAEGDQ